MRAICSVLLIILLLITMCSCKAKKEIVKADAHVETTETSATNHIAHNANVDTTRAKTTTIAEDHTVIVVDEVITHYNDSGNVVTVIDRSTTTSNNISLVTDTTIDSGVDSSNVVIDDEIIDRVTDSNMSAYVEKKVNKPWIVVLGVLMLCYILICYIKK